MKIEIRKPQHMAPKEKPQHVVKVSVNGEPERGLSGFFKLLLLTSYALCGVAIWFVAQFFLKQQ